MKLTTSTGATVRRIYRVRQRFEIGEQGDYGNSSCCRSEQSLRRGQCHKFARDDRYGAGGILHKGLCDIDYSVVARAVFRRIDGFRILSGKDAN